MTFSAKFLTFIFCCTGLNLFAQEEPGWRVHSHNDYERHIPFWKAVSAGASSVEADLFLKDGMLLVAHEPGELQAGRTLQGLYLDPLSRAQEAGYLEGMELQILIDIKSEAYTTLKAIEKSLEEYPSLIADSHIRFVISGNRPSMKDYKNYPEFIWFDHQRVEDLASGAGLDRIALVSLNFRSVSAWDGQGSLPGPDRKKIEAILATVHRYGKPFRFWATPDTEAAWSALAGMGLDFVNTDKPFECVSFLTSRKD